MCAVHQRATGICLSSAELLWGKLERTCRVISNTTMHIMPTWYIEFRLIEALSAEQSNFKKINIILASVTQTHVQMNICIKSRINDDVLCFASCPIKILFQFISIYR